MPGLGGLLHPRLLNVTAKVKSRLFPLTQKAHTIRDQSDLVGIEGIRAPGKIESSTPAGIAPPLRGGDTQPTGGDPT